MLRARCARGDYSAHAGMNRAPECEYRPRWCAPNHLIYPCAAEITRSSITRRQRWGTKTWGVYGPSGSKAKRDAMVDKEMEKMKTERQ